MRTGHLPVLLTITVIFLSPITDASAQNLTRAPLAPQQLTSIDALVRSEMSRQQIPGLAVGIYSRGKLLLGKGYGFGNVELSVPVRPETIFQSGSIGKQFVSAAIMMLVEERKVSLDDSITKYFPDAPSAWKPILIKNLLSHTSGLSEYADPVGSGGPFDLRLDYTEDELLKGIESLPIEGPPAENWVYRNTNYVLLGLLIHRVTGKPYAAYLEERIFKPLGMSSTRLISDRDIIPNRSSGYELDATGRLKNQSWVSPTFNSTADGALYFNVLDLAKWDEALYGTRLLNQSSLDRIWTDFTFNDGTSSGYGFGWYIGRENGHRILSHAGAWQGFTGSISRYPHDNLTVVVLTNLDAEHSNPILIGHVVAGLVEPALMPAILGPIADSKPEIQKRLREDLDALVAGKDIRRKTDPKLTTILTRDELFWVTLTSSLPVQVNRSRLAGVWPGGSLTLVKRISRPNTTHGETSIFRLSKGKQALLIIFEAGEAGVFGIAPDGGYEISY
jgi:CubicO group peptidase (beta-lactamase class C family)